MIATLSSHRGLKLLGIFEKTQPPPAPNRGRHIRALTLCCCALAALCASATPTQAHAEFIEVWGSLQGGYSGGAGSDAFPDGAGMGVYGFAAGVEILSLIDVFIDIRLQDALDAGTWNQIGTGWDVSFDLGVVQPFIGVRAAYVYAQFSKDARVKYEEKAASDPDASANPSNKGLNFSGQLGLDFAIVGPLYAGVMADIGYHMLLPDLTMGLNYHGLGYLKVSLGF
jgi:hypothetical protein